MAKTRSMSKILKSTDQSFHCYRGTKVKNLFWHKNERIPRPKKGKPCFYTRITNAEFDAVNIFMEKTYLKEFREKYPNKPPSFELCRAGHDEWYCMTPMEKAPYIEEVKKRRAKEHEDFLKIRKGEML
ncbi:HMG1/2-like protein [Bienertia sinuspersici]